MFVRGVLLVVVVVGIIAAARVPSSSSGTVVVDSAEVLDRPDEVGFVVAELSRGEKVSIDHETSDGWIAIQAPAAVYCWIDERSLDRTEPGIARIRVDGATPRSANGSARMPGLPQAPLKRGTQVTVLDRKPRVVPQTGGARVFRAIEPPEGQLYYIAARAVRVVDRDEGKPRAPRVTTTPLPIDASIATPGNSIRPSTLPPALLDELARVESAHWSVLRGSVETWNLDAVKRGYEDLANRYRDADSRALLEARISRASQQDELARQARRFETLVRESREHDLSKVTKSASIPEARPTFDAVGMLQRSSKLVAGQRVFALIGDNGSTIAYLSVPPGILTNRYISSQVGVRGQLHYDAKLRNRVIDVEDLSPILDGP